MGNKFGDSKKELSGLNKLSRQQIRVAEMVHDGLTNNQIADALSVEPGVVSNYISQIYHIIGINTLRFNKRVTLARWYENNK